MQLKRQFRATLLACGASLVMTKAACCPRSFGRDLHDVTGWLRGQLQHLRGKRRRLPRLEGPGVGAPQTAAGLDDGRYVFQATDPSGKRLLSTDPARCRQFDVVNGIITAVVDTNCEHLTGVDQDHGATTVQLMPYLDTPNPGGEYKVWVTLLEDFLLGCEALGVNNGLDVVNCGAKVRGNAHGFIPRHSKTDTFKVGGGPREIDTRFRRGRPLRPTLLLV